MTFELQPASDVRLDRLDYLRASACSALATAAGNRVIVILRRRAIYSLGSRISVRGLQPRDPRRHPQSWQTPLDTPA